MNDLDLLVLNGALIAMILATLIPIYEAWKNEDIWDRVLAFASISSKTAMLVLVVSVLRDDWMIGLVGAIMLIVGNAGLMLLAHLLRKMNV
jgi:multicomponent Na+:H+ antiporter subunit F